MTLIDKGQSESTQLANIWVTLESAHSALDTYDDEYDDVEARELMWHISEYMDSASRSLAATIAQSKGHPTDEH